MSIMSTSLQFHGTSIAPPENVMKTAQKTTRNYARTAVAGFTASAFTAPAVMIATAVASGAPVAAVAANGLLGIISGSLLGFTVADKIYSPSRNKTVKNYAPTVAEWLKATYNVELNSPALNEMTEIILGSEMNYGTSFLDRITSTPYMLKTKDNYWVLEPRNAKQLEASTPKVQHPEIMNFDEHSATLDAVKHKISILSNDLSSSGAKQSARVAVEELNSILLLVTQLRSLKEPDYMNTLDATLQNLHTHLTSLIEAERDQVKKKLASLTEHKNPDMQNGFSSAFLEEMML